MFVKFADNNTFVVPKNRMEVIFHDCI